VGADLAAAVCVDHRVGRAWQRDGVGQGVDGQLGGHGFGHGVADDPVGAGVVDRAQVELAVHGRVLGDVGQPQPVRCGCGQRPLDQIVVDRRSRGSAAGVLLKIRCWVPSRLTRLRLAVMPWPASSSVMNREPNSGSSWWMSTAALISCASSRSRWLTGVGGPLVERLLGQPEPPAGHRDRDAVGGQVDDQREHQFGRVWRAK
jgi:hypothetical protein